MIVTKEKDKEKAKAIKNERTEGIFHCTTDKFPKSTFVR